MSRRKGDWRDLLSTYVLALKPNKLCAGYMAGLLTLVVLFLASLLYALFTDWGLVQTAPPLAELARICPGALAGWLPQGGMARLAIGDLGRCWGGGEAYVVTAFLEGQGASLFWIVLGLLNPFYGANLAHFALSVLTYLGLFLVWTNAGGIISRLTALEYARDELPTLGEARRMVGSKRGAYFMAPVWPLAFLVGLAALNALGGLVASVPYVGRILLVFPGMPLLIVTSILMIMLVLFGVFSFGLMSPAISVGGKDALDGWSTSYTYVLWGSGRFIVYLLITAVIGVLSAIFVTYLTETLVYLLHQSVNLAFVPAAPWVSYTFGGELTAVEGAGQFSVVIGYILAIMLILVRLAPFGYLISFFFTAYTVMFFLLRKHVDNIDIEEIYEEQEEEDFMAEAPGLEAEPAPEEPEVPEAEEEAPPAEEAPETEEPPESAEEEAQEAEAEAEEPAEEAEQAEEEEKEEEQPE